MAMSSASKPPAALVGCLLDVSGSMRNVLETGKGDKRAIDRLRAILRAALKLARSEKLQNPSALMFVGAFGMRASDSSNSLVVDLCGLVSARLKDHDGTGYNHRTGHELLISLANQNDVAHVSKYIKERLKDHEARVVYSHLRRYPEDISKFVDAIPPPEEMEMGEDRVKNAKRSADIFNLALVVCGTLAGGPVGLAVGAPAATATHLAGRHTINSQREKALEDSEALKLARRVCETWLLDFEELLPRHVGEVVSLLERLEDHPLFREKDDKGNVKRTILDDLEPYLYGRTPMKSALDKTLDVFRGTQVDQRVLVLISDAESTDGDPIPTALQLQKEEVTIATIFLTDCDSLPRHLLYDNPPRNWPDIGQRTLFEMASTVSAFKHPIPVLTSLGWEVPSSGECGLHASVHSADTLEEFCSILLATRFSSTGALLDLVGRVELDAYIDDAHMRTRNQPSLQEGKTCYAHAAAAVLHMALVRIEGREGGYPSIEQIRSRILREFPPGDNGGNVLAVLDAATQWYRPLRIKEVDEIDARQAVIRRRPVLATFRLSAAGWTLFSRHFDKAETRHTILTRAHMAPYRMEPPLGGHAVVLVQCDPQSLTFLNSWGHQWGRNGSFSIEDPSVLEVNGASGRARMCFYDIFFYEGDLIATEKQAYKNKTDERIRDLSAHHRSILDLEAKCPLCDGIAPISDFTGSIRDASCPLCRSTFKPEAEHLVEALYARAGLGAVN